MFRFPLLFDSSIRVFFVTIPVSTSFKNSNSFAGIGCEKGLNSTLGIFSQVWPVVFWQSFRMQLNWPNLTPQFSYFLQIVAVILSTTGIALLAYADGIATTKTLAGVVLAAASAAGSAVYKVFFKRVFGEVSFCQVAIFFSSIGLCSLLTLWTIFLALHLTGQGNFC